MVQSPPLPGPSHPASFYEVNWSKPWTKFLQENHVGIDVKSFAKFQADNIYRVSFIHQVSHSVTEGDQCYLCPSASPSMDSGPLIAKGVPGGQSNLSPVASFRSSLRFAVRLHGSGSCSRRRTPTPSLCRQAGETQLLAPAPRLPQLSRLLAGRRALGRGGLSALGRWPGPGAVPPLPHGNSCGGAGSGCRQRVVCVFVCEFVGRAAMWRWRLLLLPVLLAVSVSVRGQDEFSLEDALPEGSTKKPPVTQKTPSSGDLDLSDAFDSGDPKPHPPENPKDTDNPKKDQPEGSDKFDDSDLWDGSLPKGGSDGSGGNERKDPTPNSGQEDKASPGAIAGIISAVGATVVASISSFIAYQKKKLCFKQSDEENVNMDSHRGVQSEPPVQRTLLEN
ncbi:CD99 antigen [Haemorhous mexicanus]|uniref:CD99 antigen n=1 Tax=Haemorhous mexicanus TaxID=30427 RepID=UPI0028BF1582|nr:CD99 antigen [Haemorhous mexicanus]